MSKYMELYKSKLLSPQEIASQIESNSIVAAPICMGEPDSIIDALCKRAAKKEVTGIEYHTMLNMPGKEYMNLDFEGDIHHVSWFFGGGTRKGGQSGKFDYMPTNFSNHADVWEARGNLDVLVLTVSPMDKHGYFSMGPYVAETPTLVELAQKIYLEVNECMPRTFGENFLHISQVAGLCEFNKPLATIPDGEPSEKEKKIGEYIVELVPDGATIQLGIGGVANAIGKALIDKKELGIHTEMFSDSMVDLIEAGVVTNNMKNIHKGKTVSTFCFGTQRVYDFIDDNPSVEMLPVRYVNDPYVIGLMDNFISVNAGLEVDFLGQVCSESIGPMPFSGSGGQFDYVKGVRRSKGGKSFIVMNSTAKNDTISKIKPMLATGAAVTTHKNEVEYVVTEYGVAALRAKTMRERTRELINIAHPKFRDELMYEAKKLNILI